MGLFKRNRVESKLVERLRQATEREPLAELDDEILSVGASISPYLAEAALAFDLDAWIAQAGDHDEMYREYRFAQHAMHLVGEIGAAIDNDLVTQFIRKFIERGLRGKANDQGWGGLWSDITQALEKLGQVRLT
jgi:hypothetical protein